MAMAIQRTHRAAPPGGGSRAGAGGARIFRHPPSQRAFSSDSERYMDG
eukprot:COSAG02_NODE_4284_length_5548_cov_60.092127_3_plen_48_part_00